MRRTLKHISSRRRSYLIYDFKDSTVPYSDSTQKLTNSWDWIHHLLPTFCDMFVITYRASRRSPRWGSVSEHFSTICISWKFLQSRFFPASVMHRSAVSPLSILFRELLSPTVRTEPNLKTSQSTMSSAPPCMSKQVSNEMWNSFEKISAICHTPHLCVSIHTDHPEADGPFGAMDNGDSVVYYASSEVATHCCVECISDRCA